MIRVKMLRRMVTVLLILSLIYANFSPAIFGVISYATSNNPEVEETSQAEENKKPMSIEISEFSKNNMLEQETEYLEKIVLNLDYETSFSEVVISDISSIIDDGVVTDNSDDEFEEKINTFYKNTKINKSELINAIGEDGSLTIEYTELEQEVEEKINLEENIKHEEIIEDVVKNEENTENQEIEKQEVAEREENIVNQEAEIEEVVENEEETEEQEVETEEIVENEAEVEEQENETPEETEVEDEEIGKQEENKEVAIVAENGLVVINKDTEADEEGYITIIYPENTISVNIKIATNVEKIEELEILNNKIIKTVKNIENVNVLETSKNILVNGEEELLNSDETITTPIEYSKTVAELGIDKTQISTTVENKVNFTITMATDKAIYDLYKNPQFIIELPNEVKTISVDNTIILNNNDFEVEAIEYGKLNGNQAILIKLKGEQTEHTKSALENTQILLETTITTENLIPTLERVVNLYYQNENAKTYDGIGNQENGLNTMPVELVSNKEIIVQTKAIIGENTFTSLREDYENVIVEPETYKTAEIIGTAINNTGKDIENAMILGSATNIGKLTGVEKVYYTENAEATADLADANNMWSAEHTEKAVKYLIVLDNFTQGQIVTFKYTMNLPENIEVDIEHVAQFEVYNNDNIKTSKITIYQEAKRLDIFEDDKIQATISFDNTEAIELGDRLKGKINIINISGEKLENVELEVIIPEGLTNVDTVSIKDERYLMLDNTIENNVLTIKNVNIDDDITIAVNMDLEEYVEPKATVKANIKYLDRQAEISNGIKVLKPSTIQATLTSNKLGTTLEENEEIEYKLTLKNKGESHIRVDAALPELEEMNIYSIKTVNKTTLEEKQIMSTDLSREINMIDLNAGDVVEITISAKAKSLEQNKKTVMYAEITGERIENIVTGKLTNKVNKAIIEEEENQEETQKQINTISGKAWVDKNKNGTKDNNEVLLKGVQAVLINTKTSKEVATVTTNNVGEYQFNNINDGTYVVEFRYNTNTFNITEYKNEGATENSDSDVVNATQKNKTVVKTEVIDVEDGTTENVNIGLVINQKFDMSIEKGITEVTVNNEQGTNTYNFENNSMAKVEIDGENLKGSLIIVEYEISVTNIGELAGYAKLISDQIPEGMKFSSELNTNWYEGENGKIYCEALSDKELLPGETATIKLVLIKEMTDDKITSPVSTVKIEETFNEYLIEDKTQENNLAEATIIISLTTGQTTSYLWLILLVATIIGFGTFGTIKIVKRDVTKVTKQGKE